MLHIHRLPLIFTIFCIGLSACATATPLPTATLLPSETFTPTEIPSTETPAPTETPTPTETPAKIIDLDVNGDGNADYTATVLESQNVEVNEGEIARFDKIRIYQNSELGFTGFDTQWGYLVGYDIVKVNELDAELVFFRVKYFREDKAPITVEFSMLKDVIDKSHFNYGHSLGRRADISLFAPMDKDFTDLLKRRQKEGYDLTDDEAKMMYPEGAQWSNQYDVIRSLKNSNERLLDFKYKVLAATLNH